MKNDEFTHYYGSHRRRSNYVVQRSVVHKGKKFQFRADGEQAEYIENLAKELGQSESKVIKDMIDERILDKKLREQKFEIDWDKSDLPKRIN